MNAYDWIAALPNSPGPERDRLVLEAVGSCLVYCNWLPVTSSAGGHTATFQVCDDAARVELEDGSRFRVQVSATLAQQCADVLGASLLTAKVMDLSYQQAQVVLGATLLKPGADMVTTAKSKAWNQAVEQKRSGREGLIRDCGKAWILSNAAVGPNGACNYGFYDKAAPYVSPGGLRMWQTVGSKHDRAHTDYSQTLILMADYCEVDGQQMKIAEVLTNPELCALASYEGVLKDTRQRGIK